MIFYLANYAAHAATTRSLPGEKNWRTMMAVLVALFFPAAGAFRGILGITSLAVFGKSDLDKAAKAGALCMIVRGPDWEPRNGDTLENTLLCLPAQPTEGDNSSPEKTLPIPSSQKGAILGINTTEPEARNFRLMMYDPPWNFTDLMYGDDLNESEYLIHGIISSPRAIAFHLFHETQPSKNHLLKRLPFHIIINGSKSSSRLVKQYTLCLHYTGLEGTKLSDLATRLLVSRLLHTQLSPC